MFTICLHTNLQWFYSLSLSNIKLKCNCHVPLKVAYFPKICYRTAFHYLPTVAPAHRFVGPPCDDYRPSKNGVASNYKKSIDKLIKIGLQHFETIAENNIYYVNRRVGAAIKVRWKNGTGDRFLPTGQSSISIKGRGLLDHLHDHRLLMTK